MFKELFTESKNYLEGENVQGMFESKPKVADTYTKIKDWDLKALKGYARKIGLPDEIIRDLKHDEMAIDEIMDFLYNDDWLRDLMRAGIV